MPDPQPRTQLQFVRMYKLVGDHERPPTRERPPKRRDGQASRVQPKRAPERTPGIQMVQFYLQVHD
jgi:hypothetical protein